MDEAWFHIDPPATPEKIFFASKDQIANDLLSNDKNVHDDKEEVDEECQKEILQEIRELERM